MTANFSKAIDYLGPARLVEASAADMRAQLPSGEEVSIELALAYGYQPVVGDELVVVGKATRWYVIGVMATSGEVQLQFHGDVKLTTDGTLELNGGEGVEITGDNISWRARRVLLAADTVLQRAGTLLQKVRGLASLRSGEKHEVVEGVHATRAQRAQWTARDTVTVNGKEIHLG